MAIWVSSDWHCQPDKLKKSVVEWITLGKLGHHRLIGDGDLFDILPLGVKKFENAASIKELAALLDGYPFDYVAGNHDPHRTMKKLLAPYPTIILHKQLELEERDRTYLINHGHGWGLHWGYFGLRHFAPWIVEKAVDVAPGMWYRFCRSRGWLAHPGTEEREPGLESQKKATRLTRLIWAGASDHALNKDCCVIVGHTHTAGRRERGIGREQGFECYMIDDGDLPDGSYVEITDDAELKFLQSAGTEH